MNSYVGDVMRRPDVEPHWYQMPIRIFNAASTSQEWLECWKEGAEWIRDKDDLSIKENTYGTDRFAKLFPAIAAADFDGFKTAILGGVRAQETPSRIAAVTTTATYKHVTWGKVLNPPNQYTFYPIYDWSWTDVWKAIHDGGWQYCKLYDYMYQYGVPPTHMRVSSVHHECSLRSLYILQEIEPDTWDAVTKRVHGANSAGHLKAEAFGVSGLPPIFKDWKEYRDHLLNTLVTNPKSQRKLRAEFDRMDAIFIHPKAREAAHKVGVRSVLRNDYALISIKNFNARPEIGWYRRYVKGQRIREAINSGSPYVKEAIRLSSPSQ